MAPFAGRYMSVQQEELTQPPAWLREGSFVFLNARLFMFADVNICKSRCWARADWGPLEGLEEALFTCSEECCPAWTLLYLSGSRGSQRRQRWAALSLSKVSTSQYQQRSTMWATWEEEMEFLLVLLRRSQTQSQCPLVPLRIQGNAPQPCCLFWRCSFCNFLQGACDLGTLLLDHSWLFLWVFKMSQTLCRVQLA